MNPDDTKNELWYVDNILPHRDKLRSWLLGSFPGLRDVDDIVQESMLKVYKASSTGPVINPKAYLFLTARNLVISRFRHEKFEHPPQENEIDLSEILVDWDDPREQASKNEELQLLIEAIKSLPTGSRRAITLRKIYGYSLKETAKILGISVSSVGTQCAIAIEKCGDYFEKHRIGKF